MDVWLALWLFAISLGASALGGMLGMASGIFIVPILTILGHVDIRRIEVKDVWFGQFRSETIYPRPSSPAKAWCSVDRIAVAKDALGKTDLDAYPAVE